MPNFTDLTGLASVASAIAAAVLLLPRVSRLARHHLATALVTVFVVALIPFNGFPIAAYVRGATGDLSITAMVLLWCALLRRLRTAPAVCEAPAPKDRLTLLMLIALAAITLYPMALGIGAFDPYRLGFGNWLFMAMLLLIALAAWFWKCYPIALCVALAAFAWAIGWYESGNLWDYLLDPFVSIYALGAVMFHAIKTLVKQMRSRVQ